MTNIIEKIKNICIAIIHRKEIEHFKNSAYFAASKYKSAFLNIDRHNLDLWVMINGKIYNFTKKEKNKVYELNENNKLKDNNINDNTITNDEFTQDKNKENQKDVVINNNSDNKAIEINESELLVHSTSIKDCTHIDTYNKIIKKNSDKKNSMRFNICNSYNLLEVLFNYFNLNKTHLRLTKYDIEKVYFTLVKENQDYFKLNEKIENKEGKWLD